MKNQKDFLSRGVGIGGLGYASLPLTMRFTEAGYSVLGFDIDPEKVKASHAERSNIKHIGDAAVSLAIKGEMPTTTKYQGSEMLNGEYKVMGMAPYGDPSKYDFSRLSKFENGELIINTDYANVIGFSRHKEKDKGYDFSPQLIEWLGPMHHGDIANDPYIHYAASMQKLLEDLVQQMMDYYLGNILKETGKQVFDGGALNVKLNQKINARPELKELFVQPASGDAGTAIGAAAYVSPSNAACRSPGGSKDAWNSLHSRWAGAPPSAARAPQASPTGSTNRSTSANAGAPYARACSTRPARRFWVATTQRHS
jgi:predicted NodU family carbamoyl transferase